LALETDLKIEREWRGTLQQNLDKEKAKVARLQTDIQHLEETKKVFSQCFSFCVTFCHFHSVNEKSVEEIHVFKVICFVVIFLPYYMII